MKMDFATKKPASDKCGAFAWLERLEHHLTEINGMLTSKGFVAYRSRCSGTGNVFVSKNTGEAYVDRKHFVTKLCKRAGVKQFNFHGIRGLCATLLAQNNVPMKQIQSVLMHSNMMTTDRYIRRIGGVSDELVRAFETFEKTETACKVVSFQAVS